MGVTLGTMRVMLFGVLNDKRSGIIALELTARGMVTWLHTNFAAYENKVRYSK